MIKNQQQFKKWLESSDLIMPVSLDLVIPREERAALCALFVKEIEKIPPNSRIRFPGILEDGDGVQALLEAIQKHCKLSTLSGLCFDYSYMKIGSSTEFLFSLIQAGRVPADCWVSLRASCLEQGGKFIDGKWACYWKQLMKVIKNIPEDHSSNLSFDCRDNALSIWAIGLLENTLKKMKAQNRSSFILSFNLKNTNHYRSTQNKFYYAQGVQGILSLICDDQTPPLKLMLDTTGFNVFFQGLWKQHTVDLEDELNKLFESEKRSAVQLSFVMNSSIVETPVYEWLNKYYQANLAKLEENPKNILALSQKLYGKKESHLLQLNFSSELNYQRSNKNDCIRREVLNNLNALAEKMKQCKISNHSAPYNIDVCYHDLLTLAQLKSILLKRSSEFSELMDRYTVIFSSKVMQFLKKKNDFVICCLRDWREKEVDCFFYQSEYHHYRQGAVSVLFYRLQQINQSTWDDRKKSDEFHVLFNQFCTLDLFIYTIISIIGKINLSVLCNEKDPAMEEEKQQISDHLNELIVLLINGYEKFSHQSNYQYEDLKKEINQFFEEKNTELFLEIKNYESNPDSRLQTLNQQRDEELIKMIMSFFEKKDQTSASYLIFKQIAVYFLKYDIEKKCAFGGSYIRRLDLKLPVYVKTEEEDKTEREACGKELTEFMGGNQHLLFAKKAPENLPSSSLPQQEFKNVLRN